MAAATLQSLSAGNDDDTEMGGSTATRLWEAVAEGSEAEVARLLKEGADVNVCASDCDTPLHAAAREGHLGVARLLVAAGRPCGGGEAAAGAGADVNQADNNGWSPLFAAALNGRMGVVRLLAEVGADANQADIQGQSPLFVAALNGNVELTRLLVEVEADVNKAAVDGTSPLKAAASFGHMEVVRLLVEAGADLNQTANNGASPLICAALEGHLGIVRVLVGAGADFDQADDIGWTALTYAIHFNCKEAALLLLAHGAQLGPFNLLEIRAQQQATLLTWQKGRICHQVALIGQLTKTNDELVAG
eukprot:CAMPEP_0117652398 /NCGR_PEP_ID=MMETSP0804-20121206/2607_1 /TAXON_ID=1074897 /ORGANISM="Tetraselmis astigmatica, Strain CCMP880" /LENGTH=304 /DNA_ID=CAMNT_0005458445 /DNA_START=282 /DNA_END=1194 /DNA_ORIENTATION=-